MRPGCMAWCSRSETDTCRPSGCRCGSKDRESKEMKSGTRGHPQSIERYSECLSTITSPSHAGKPWGSTHNHVWQSELQCENGPLRVHNQKAAQNIHSKRKRCTHSEQADDFYPLSFFTHLMSVSLFLTGPLYSFSQKLHTGERHIVRKCGWRLSRSVNGALQALVKILKQTNKKKYSARAFICR